MRTSIVVVAYGPGRVTGAALRRASSLAGDAEVLVVAGLPPGLAAVRDAAGGRVRAVGGCGSDALREALEHLPDGPVLVAHDDVLVTRSALDRMEQALDRAGGIVLPYSNDVGMDHFVGPLPEVRRARRAVEERARRVAGAPPEARTVRPSCLLARRDDLLGLVPSHIVDPRMKLEIVDLPVRIAPGAVVAHDSTCSRRLVELPADPYPPLLVAAMIVRDEEDMLPGCLRSLAGLVDEVVVCDTGSTDATVEVALRLGATVIHRAWREDFGWARSEAVAAASRAVWVLTVDADDRVVCPDPTGVRRMLATYADEYEAFSVVVENRAGSPEGPVGSAFDSPRIFRGGRFEYVGAVHEVLVSKGAREKPFAPRMEALRIVHLGYQPEVLRGRGKAHRNLTMAREQFARDPSPKHAIDYARSIKLAGGDRRESFELMRGILEVLPETERAASAYVHTLVSEDLLVLGEPEAALQHARTALELVPADDLAARAFAAAALRLGRPAEVVAMEERRASAPSVRPVFRSDVARAGAMSLLAAAHASLGRLEAAREVAREALATSAEGFDGWEVLVAVHARLPEDRALEELVALALRDPQGGVFPALAETVRPAFTARFCLAYLERGGEHPEAVRTGLAAAMVAGLPDVFAGISRSSGLLDPEVVERIAERAEARGRPDLADLLRRARAPVPAGEG